MAIGISGNDLGASPEVLFDEAAKIGKLVVETAEKRSNLKIKDLEGKEDTPNIPFLEKDKLSTNFIELLQKGETVDKGAIDDAKMASLGLSLEAGIQIVNAKSVKPPGIFIERLDSLQEIQSMLDIVTDFVRDETNKRHNLVENIAVEVARIHDMESAQDPSEWANEIMSKASERMNKKVGAVKSLG